MTTHDSPDRISSHSSEDLLLRLQLRKEKIVSDIATLLKKGTIEDKTDQKLIAEAATFIENPTENLPDIMRHTTHVGEVLGGYEMQGLDIPVEIDTMHSYLLALQCINRMNFIEKELGKSIPDITHIRSALTSALDWATILSRGYKDNTLLEAINELRDKIKNL